MHWIRKKSESQEFLKHYSLLLKLYKFQQSMQKSLNWKMQQNENK